MSRVEVRDLGEPEAVVTYPLGTSSQVRLGGTVVTRHVLQPGWSWEEHAQPLVGTTSCELYHRGVVLRGRMGLRTDEGDQLIIEPNHVFDLPPGHVTWVEGDEELVMVDWAGGAGFDTRPGEERRTMATILFTDIVTPRCWRAKPATWPGNGPWPCTTTSSGTRWPASAGPRSRPAATRSWSSSTEPSAIRCALTLVEALAAIRIPIRVGIHSGEVVSSGDQVPGVAVHTAARILAEAGAGEALVSGSTRDLAEGARGLTFDSRGSYPLKGLEREHELFAAGSSAETAPR
jgi:hypothetical protein